LTGLSFLVSTPKAEAVFFSEKIFPSQYTPQELLLEIEKEITSNDVLKQCEEVCIIYANTTYTLVPDALFDDKRLSEYLKFNSKILAGDYIAYDTLTAQSIHVVYVPLINVNNYLFDTFGSFKYYHATSVLLQYVFEKLPVKSATKAFIQVYDGHFDLLILKNGSLLLCNSYSYKTPEDLAYYVLFAIEQLQLKPETIETSVLGAIEETDPNFEILYTYIRNLSVLNVTGFTVTPQAKPHQQLLLKNCF